jgi:hypothetical protein
MEKEVFNESASKHDATKQCKKVKVYTTDSAPSAQSAS